MFAPCPCDDASKSISIVVNYMAESIRQGLIDRERTKSEKPATAEE